MSVTISTLLLSSGVLLMYDIHQTKKDIGNELTNSARLLSNRSSAALIFEDPTLAKENLNALKELPHINLGCIYQDDNTLFASYIGKDALNISCPSNPNLMNHKMTFNSDFVKLSIPIETSNKIIGHIYIHASLESINQRIFQHIYLTIILVLSVSLLAFLLSRKLQKIISEPLKDVAEIAILIEQQKDYSQRAPERYTDEIGQLCQAFNAMLETIEQQNSELLESKNNLEAEVNKRTKELELVINELDSFSYSVSHDLRAPLRSITGFSQAILEDYKNEIDDEGKELLNRVVKNTKKMSDLINDLLKLSRLGRKKLTTESVNFDDLVTEIANSLTENSKNRKIEFKLHTLGNVIADQNLLQIATENLLNNAWKYTSKKENSIIEVGKKSINGEKVYYIKDNGAGFDIAFADKLFGAFQRLHKQNEFEGTGIGLATVQRIIHRHGGRIWAESEINKGSTFYFTLPNNH